MKQKKKSDIPIHHHVARYCNTQLVDRDPETLVFRGIFPQAFALRENDRGYLSVSWFEKFAGGNNSKLKGVIGALRGYMKEVRPKAAIAVLNVGFIVNTGTRLGHPIRVRDKTSKSKPQYAGIEGMPLNNSDGELLEILSSVACIHKREVAEILASPDD